MVKKNLEFNNGKAVEGLVDAQSFKGWHDCLLNSIIAVVRNRDKAEDITAAAFAKAFEARHTFRGESSVLTWLQTIARNEVRNGARQNRGVSIESIDGLASEELSEPDMLMKALEFSENSSKLSKALDRLGPIYRRTLVSHFVYGHSIKQIARQERVPIGTILSRIFAGKRLLRAEWEA